MTDNGVYFYAYEGQNGPNYTWEIWTSDGTPEGTYRVYMHQAPTLAGFDVHWPIAEGNQVFFIGPSGGSPTLFTLDLDRDRAPGDFNGNARHTSADLDLLWRNIHASSDDLTFDMNGDRAVTPADVTAWVVAQQTHTGDITLDGDVDYLDLVAVRNNYTGTITTGYQRPWALGNFDGDDDTDFDDVVTMRLHLGAGESGEWFGVTPPDRHGPLPEDGPAAVLMAEYDPRTGLIHLLGQTLRDLVALEIVGQDGNLIRSDELSSALPFIIDDQPDSLVLLALNGQTINGQLLLGEWGDTDLVSLEGLSIRYALDGDATARTAAVQVVPEPAAGMLLAGAALLTLHRRRRG